MRKEAPWQWLKERLSVESLDCPEMRLHRQTNRVGELTPPLFRYGKEAGRTLADWV